jgi:uncharacterized protein DUF1573
MVAVAGGLPATAEPSAWAIPFMPRSPWIIGVFAVVFALLAVGLVGRWAIEQTVEPEPLQQTGGRVQLVIDEQDVGAVRQETILEVPFAVGNSGSERLLLRQAPNECCGGDEQQTFSVEPGQTSEVTVRLAADDLIGRGKKNIRFFTSDASCPELWVTVRGTVIRRAAASDDAAVEWSVLVK